MEVKSELIIKAADCEGCEFLFSPKKGDSCHYCFLLKHFSVLPSSDIRPKEGCYLLWLSSQIYLGGKLND